MWNGTLYYTDSECYYNLTYTGSDSYPIHNSWTDSEAFDTVPSSLLPSAPVYSHTGDTRLVVRLNNSTGKLQYVSSATISNPVFRAVLSWKY